MWLIDTLNEFINRFLIQLITSNLKSMFTSVNEQIGGIANQIAKSPMEWNSSIFTMVKIISDSVIMPLATLIISYTLCYEIISMILEKNNFVELEIFSLMKCLFKSAIAIWVLAHSMEICLAIFDVAATVTDGVAHLITLNTSIDISNSTARMIEGLETLNQPQLFIICLETAILRFYLEVMALLIVVVLYCRMIDIYIHLSIAPIPFAALTNRTLNSMGNSYIRNILSMAFEGFFMLVCVALYSILIKTLVVTADFEKTLFSIICMVTVLCTLITKARAISNSIFGGVSITSLDTMEGLYNQAQGVVSRVRSLDLERN